MPKMGALKWVLTPKPARYTKAQLDEKIPMVKTDMKKISVAPSSGMQVTWIGHSTSLIQMDGVSFLTDPVFADRASPSQWIGPKRYRDTPFKLNELPKVDFVVISHDHYDHLDESVVRHIGDKTRWYVPFGTKKWFADCGVTNVVELEWWQSYNHSDEIQVIFTPAQHWSKRHILERNTRMWGSWVVKSKQQKVFFSGDTGYCDVFKTIGEEYGPFDFSMIAIGAYEPRELMKPQHVNPEEAVMMHEDLRSKLSMGIHWGTFVLTDEPEDEPPIKVTEHMNQRGLSPDSFVVFNIGETRTISEGKQESLTSNL
eukprot:TRINITY_DN1307_c0_g1_i1.p1 TRINITY_DN1307_c0_g1~~TRINITY_DN1307_c0_g1_i1.p1  ORF type:complete len:368 (+),score=109.50 TRINITY_DN1307_c0_g1_i1:167-1105(+)